MVHLNTVIGQEGLNASLSPGWKGFNEVIQSTATFFHFVCVDKAYERN